MEQSTTRWGIISTARIAERAFIPAVRQTAAGEVAAVASRKKSTAHAFAEENAIPLAVEGYENLLKRDDIDAVYIGLPNSLHKEWTEAAAGYGKHVFCEKPLASDAAEAQSMVEECKKHNVLFFEAFVFLYHPQTSRLREILDQKGIGNLVKLYACCNFHLPRPTDNIRLKSDLAGGSLMDTGSYPITFARFVFGEEPQAVQASWYVDPEYGVDTRVSMLLTFSGDRHALLDCGFDNPPGLKAFIQGDKGSIDIPQPYHPREQSLFTVTRGKETWTLNFDNGLHPFTPAVNHFQDCLLNHKQPIVTAENAVGTMRAIDAVREAAAKGSVIKLA